MLEVKPVTPDLVPDADELFGSSPGTAGCSCMWFIIPVKQYHAGGAQVNRGLFHDLVESNPAPIGLLAYRGGEPVGWCAAGPRSRYARALRVPSFKGRDPEEDGSIWLVPCFYIRKEVRREGVARALLEGAVTLAREQGAPAIEGFPFARGAKVSSDSMVGVESLFESQGFTVTRRPSATWVVMRRDLGPS